MSKNVILLGDKTSHGGTVITATSDTIINSKRAAKIGDIVSYPKKRHSNNCRWLKVNSLRYRPNAF